MEPKERLILALDVDTEKEALQLVEMLHNEVGLFKIGMQLFNSVGPDIVRKVNLKGGKVFVDLKLHDIPNTVAAAARVVTRLGCSLFNVHAAGGQEMMRQTVKAVRQEAPDDTLRPKILAVTVLTSLGLAQLKEELHIELPLERLVVEWAMMARDCGLDGVVASPHEITAIRKACGNDFLIVTPGVRPEWAATNDQKRITTPRQALEWGADYLVIGRPITAAKDPVAAARRICEEI